jgi:hypothetical protein
VPKANNAQGTPAANSDGLVPRDKRVSSILLTRAILHKENVSSLEKD